MSKKVNGNINIDTLQMEQMRQTVVEQELSARSWKAFYEKMYYSLEAEKIEPLYKEYQERTQKRLEEEKAKMDEFMKNLQEEMQKKNEENPAGTISLEEVN